MFSYLLDIYLGLELLGHMVTNVQLFEELPDCFSKQQHHFTFPLTVFEDSSFSASSPAPVIISVLSVDLKMVYLGLPRWRSG